MSPRYRRDFNQKEMERCAKSRINPRLKNGLNLRRVQARNGLNLTRVRDLERS